MAGRIAPLKRGPRRGVPLPGVGGYDYPRGPYGATGFPGSTPASPPTHAQSPEGQKGARQGQLGEPGTLDVHGVPQHTVSRQQWEWGRYASPSGLPYNPGARNQPLATGTERRDTPAINNRPPGDQNQRNTVYYGGRLAMPGQVRSYMSAPNPGKNGGQPATYRTWGYDNDAGTVKGGQPTPVTVPSRFVAPPDLDGYAMNRNEVFARFGPDAGNDPGYAAFPPGYSGDYHLRGGRLTGERYFGALADQQRIGLPSDAFGIARRRGPRHRPTRFEQPGSWTRNYYDVAPEHGTEAPDMIHQSPTGRRKPRSVKRRGR